MRFPLPRLGLAVALAAFSAGCGRGELEEGVPKDAFSQAAPPLSEAQQQMKDKVAKQKGLAPPAAKGTPGGGSSYIERMKAQNKAGSR